MRYALRISDETVNIKPPVVNNNAGSAYEVNEPVILRSSAQLSEIHMISPPIELNSYRDLGS